MRRGILPNSVMIMLVSLLLSACGGSDSAGSFTGDGTGGGTGGGGGGTDDPTLPTITLELLETDLVTPKTRVDGSGPGIARATISNASENVIVNFSTTIGQLSPSSGAILSSGNVATINVVAGDIEGAGTIQASASVGGTNVSSNSVAFEVVPFDVVAENFQLGTCSGGTGPLDCSAGTTFTQGGMVIGVPVLAARGTSGLSLVVVDESNAPASGVTIDFTSQCEDQGLASITSGTSNSQGVVNSSYKANGCEGNDEITAREPTSDIEPATGTIEVQPAIIGSIVFDSVTDAAGNSINTIFIQESGGNNTALVTFQILDRFGSPVEGERVEFALTTEVGGLSLDTDSDVTDADGRAVAIVNAGFVVTTVRVTATLPFDSNNDGTKDSTKVTQSEQLSVNTGIADQDSMSISATILNVEGEQFDGNETDINIRLSDAFNNPVRDGTSVQFRTEYGSIEPFCNTAAGACSVTWTSQEPRRPLIDHADVRFVGDNCPTPLIVDEPISVATVDGMTTADTDFTIGTVLRVELTANEATVLVEDTDYEYAQGDPAITCLTGSANCTNTTNLNITYTRLYVDEEADGGIDAPGVPTAPFRATARSGAPCATNGRGPGEFQAGYNGGLGQIYGGRSTVIAFAQGEESFVDSNSNGIYDLREPFVDLTEAFLDVNEDGVFGGNGTAGTSKNGPPECYWPSTPLTPEAQTICYQEGGDEDRLIDFNSDNEFDIGNRIYNGSLCPREVDERDPVAAFCDNGVTTACTATDRFCTRDLIHIRRSIPILSAGSSLSFSIHDGFTGEFIGDVDLTNVAAGRFTAFVGVDNNAGGTIGAGTEFTIGVGNSEALPATGETVSLTSGSGFVLVAISDQFGGIPPAGTAVTVESGDCDIVATSTGSVPSSSGTGPFLLSMSLAPADNPVTASGPVTITATPPTAGIAHTVSFNCQY